MEVVGHRKIGRLKLRWSDVLRKDMNEKGVKIEEDRRTWRLKTRCADSKLGKGQEVKGPPMRDQGS